MTTMLPRDWGLAAACGALLADQASKLTLLYGYGFKDMGSGQDVAVLPFFNLVMVWNRGVSYGLLSFLTPGIIVFLSFLAVLGLGWWLWRTTSRPLAVGLGLIIGGAIGNNLIDRVIYGKVADFFHFYVFGYSWYVFNVADAAITFGVIALIYDSLMRPETKLKTR